MLSLWLLLFLLSAACTDLGPSLVVGVDPARAGDQGLTVSLQLPLPLTSCL